MKNQLFLLLFVFVFGFLQAQEKKVVEVDMTLDDVINLAEQQSLYSFKLKNEYLSSYWEYRSYKADRLPSLTLSSTPVNFDRSVSSQFISEDEGYKFVASSDFYSDVSLSLEQIVPFTGGVFDITSSSTRNQNLDNETVEYATVPVSVGFTQSLNGYNSYAWDAKIEPLKFEQAKLDYLQSLETMSIQVANYFFNVATAEINKHIAEVNYSNADTLYRIGKGRFEIGSLTQDELLDLELSLLNARLAVSSSEISLIEARADLNSYLGIDDDFQVNCVIPSEVPDLQVPVDKAVALARERNPDILGYKMDILEADEDVDETRSDNGFSADVSLDLGLNKNDDDLATAYKSPFLQQQQIEVSLSVPIIDWGEGKGEIEMARSDREVVGATVKQALRDFEQDAVVSVLSFNLQKEQVKIAAKADTIAQLGYEVTKQRFLIGKVDVIRLNSARNSLDAARRSYIDALRTYWVSYYGIRELTLYDFENDRPLLEEFDKLLQQ
jgi:outer membrane protein TolC